MEKDNRREFLKKTSLLAGGFGLWSSLPASIQKAIAIDPAKGSTFEDAEHIVLLMQENRSFDHCFGSLRGVRGFDDPRAITLPNGNPVWLQTNKEGKTYAPFHLDIKDTKITWMGGLPHTWENQVDARNNGKYDKWLDAKRTGYKGFEDKPMTLGYYKREDIPFNYAMADAFTVCDQHFCSSLTGTTPNRLYFFSGTLRKDCKADEPALVRNDEIDFKEIEWETYPELLEKNGLSWKVYQNEISTGSTLEDEAEFWLGNFTDNSLEWFKQYHVRRSSKFEKYLIANIEKTKKIILDFEQSANFSLDENIQKKHTKAKTKLSLLETELEKCRKALSTPLSTLEQALHDKAFVTNESDPNYSKIDKVTYNDRGTSRTMDVPKSDVLANFRNDVHNGTLPSVSWMVAPQAFSDHPSAPWFGAWYVSEVLDILTENPDVWKKTIFIVTYDENDGYFDHVPPFVAPDYRDESTGKVSAGIKNIDAEFVTKEDELGKKKVSNRSMREGPIGLGYRVPFIVASPWSRGGYVNSQVFDHTSVGQFLEGFIKRKTGKEVRSANISDWRRAICGDLSSIFRPYNDEKILQPQFLDRDAYLQSINDAKYKPTPSGINELSADAIKNYITGKRNLNFTQEVGFRPSNALPYELSADIEVLQFGIKLKLVAANAIFKSKAAGAAFTVYSRLPYGKNKIVGKNWNFAVVAGEILEYSFEVSDFPNGNFELELYGSNGFYRLFKGCVMQHKYTIAAYSIVDKKNKHGLLNIVAKNNSRQEEMLKIADLSYGMPTIEHVLYPQKNKNIRLALDRSGGWYDILITVANDSVSYRYSGRVENGKESYSDKNIGKNI